MGDAYGNKPDTKWVPTMMGFTKSGGPMHWIRMHYACTYCNSRPVDYEEMATLVYDKCCPGRPQGLACIPDNATRYKSIVCLCTISKLSLGMMLMMCKGVKSSGLPMLTMR